MLMILFIIKTNGMRFTRLMPWTAWYSVHGNVQHCPKAFKHQSMQMSINQPVWNKSQELKGVTFVGGTKISDKISCLVVCFFRWLGQALRQLQWVCNRCCRQWRGRIICYVCNTFIIRPTAYHRPMAVDGKPGLGFVHVVECLSLMLMARYENIVKNTRGRHKMVSLSGRYQQRVCITRVKANAD